MVVYTRLYSYIVECMTDLLSVNEAAERLRVQPRTVRDYIHAGRLRAARIGKQYRIRVEDLDVFSRGGAEPVPPAFVAATGEASVGAGTSMATVILDIDTRDASAAGRVTSLATARGFADGVDLHLTTVAGTSAIKIILTGPIGGVLDTAAAVRRALELTHD